MPDTSNRHNLPQEPSDNSLRYQALDPREKRQRLKELAQVFFKLGTIAFGGPAAHIAMIEDEVVRKRQWMERQKLLDLLSVTNFIPGPNSTELVIHIGLERGGWLGLIVAGICFILPAMAIVWILAAIYVRYQSIPEVSWFFYGIKPVIIAIVLQAAWKLAKTAIKNLWTAIAGTITIALAFLGINEILLLVLAGLIVMLAGMLYGRFKIDRDRNTLGLWFYPASGLLAVNNLAASNVDKFNAIATAISNPIQSVGWLSVFLFFLKIGSVLYGSGYVLLAFLQQDLVQRSQWLTSQQLLDAVTVGQITPGPVFTTATFIGYLLAGNLGAIAATIGIFLPAFVLVAAVNPLVPNLRRSVWTANFLDGVNAGSLGLMAVVTWELGRAALIDWLTIILASISAVIIFRFKINSVWLVLGGGAIGFVFKFLSAS